MTSPDDLVTVYRSADSNAEQDATAVFRMLSASGVAASLCDDSVRGIVTGTWEVRVLVDDVEHAESLIALVDVDDPARPDPSAHLDAVTIAELQGTTGEIEAMGIKSILDASDIPNVLVGASTLPSLSFQIQVPAAEVGHARDVLAEAEAAGPAAAVEAERESEGTA